MSPKSKKTARHEQDEQIKKAMLGEHYPEDMHVYRLDRHNFTIYIGGDPQAETEAGEEPGVEHKMADRFAINLGILKGIDPERPVLIELSSCGGNWTHGIKMFGHILAYPAPVTVLGTFDTRSMTSIIPLAADRFLIQPPAQYMYHCGSYGFLGLEQEANTDDIERRKMIETMFRIYVARLKSQGAYKGWEEQSIRDMLEERMRKEIDVWLTADEAKRWGFADDVFEGNWKTLRATKINIERRKLMAAVLRKKVKVEIRVS
ncbi:MAG: ATP-dependent Clp protease proteolytic subunit [bacterium]|nr:ATP-dependent Clp protease proteolytic subunit [bacterium]